MAKFPGKYLFFVCSCFVTLQFVTCKTGPYKLSYTIENHLRGYEPYFRYTLMMEFVCGEPFVSLMYRAAEKDTHFQFQSKCYLKLGEYITEINGLDGSIVGGPFWAFMLRKSNKDCLLTVGVSSYFPGIGDHVVFSFQNSTIFDKLPKCK